MWRNPKYTVAVDAAYDFAMMPILHINIAPVEVRGDCVGSIRASLVAYLDNKNHTIEMLPTHSRHVPSTIEIWSSSYSFKSSREGFTAFATHIAEDLMRELVNDWSTSQDLQDLFVPAPQR